MRVSTMNLKRYVLLGDLYFSLLCGRRYHVSNNLLQKPALHTVLTIPVRHLIYLVLILPKCQLVDTCMLACNITYSIIPIANYSG